MRYVLDFGTANAGGAPTFTTFVNVDTLAAATQPAIVEIGGGLYYFDYAWATSAATSIAYKAELSGVELAGVVSSTDSSSPTGVATASAGTSSLNGYSTVATLINRAAVQCGLSAVADPFASTDAKFVQLVEYLTTLGVDLLSQREWGQLTRECSILTAGSASAYALPADYSQMIDQTGWNRSDTTRLIGPTSAQYTQYLKAWGGPTTIGVPFRLQGNMLTFPVVPADGLTIIFEYLSTNWLQSAASGTGPDLAAPTAATDYVLFDPLLVVFGLKFLWLQGKGLPEASVALAQYEQRLDYCKAKDRGAPVLNLGGQPTGVRFIDTDNLPVTGYGL